MRGVYGGVFDPPHLGHVALARAAREAFSLDRLHVRVVVDPGHKRARATADARLRLAAAAFEDVPGATVEPEPHERTVDALEAEKGGESIFLVGADEWREFAGWKRPERVLELTRIGVATRPGYDVTIPPDWAGRVVPFAIEPLPTASTDVRARVARGEPVEGLVPAAVARLIAELGLYGRE